MPLVAQSCFARWRNVWSFWLMVAAALSPLVGLRLLTDQSFFLSFGVAFATVKSLGLVMIAYGGRQDLVWRDVFLLIFFFPLFTVGPVERLNTFAHTNFSTHFDRKQAKYGIYRIAVGLFLILLICSEMLEPLRDTWFGRSNAEINGFDRVDAFGLIIVSFLYTYLNFEGFSSIAIGISRLFGLKVIENFDRPLMVTNIADFWKRYHISMGNWINQFLFFPIVLLIKRPWASYLSTIIAFVLFGLWHSFDLNYLAWGFANGIAVATIHLGMSKKVFPLVKNSGPLKRTVGIGTGAITLLFISWIQTFANLESFDTALLLTEKLIGG
ncbi:MAG: MBOAT family O-acyltransferase [Roseobacter sp.]